LILSRPGETIPEMRSRAR